MQEISPENELVLVTGDRNLSSWSLRPWILLRHLGLPFREIRLRLDTPEFRQTIASWSPTRKVPVLRHGPVSVWDSVAICEYASELAGGAGWPASAAERAVARAVSAEMHSGFAALREQWPMQAARKLVRPLDAAGRADVERIDALWQECLDRRGGPWLFGRYSIADAMYAPVALRFNTYRASLPPVSAAYVAAVLADPWMQEWLADAAAELAGTGATP